MAKPARPLLSLSNGFSNDDVEDFVAGWVRKFLSLSEADAAQFVAEPKIDGLSLSLRYEDGRLVQAATRGDGTQGEVSPPMSCSCQPTKTAWITTGDFEVRGEMYMDRHDFDAQRSAGK